MNGLLQSPKVSNTTPFSGKLTLDLSRMLNDGLLDEFDCISLQGKAHGPAASELLRKIKQGFQRAVRRHMVMKMREEPL